MNLYRKRIYKDMQTKSNIQLAVENIQYRQACQASLQTLVENYRVSDAIFAFDSKGELVEISEGYATVQKEMDSLQDAVNEAVAGGMAIRVVENKLQLVKLHKSITECEEGYKTLELMGVDA